MLKLLRHKNVSKMVLWGILILILPAFVIWGTGSLGKDRQKGPKFVGMLDGKKISFEKFAESVSGVRCQIFLNYFNNDKALKELMSNQALIGKISWDRLIMLKEARRMKIKADDKDVIEFIRSHPLFLRNGKFDPQIYGYILRNNLSMDPRTFEEIVRENILMQKLGAQLTKDIKVSDDELLSYYRADRCKFKVSYALLSDMAGAKDADDAYKKISGILKANGNNFEGACSQTGLKPQETVVFSKSDYLEGLGEAMPVAATAGGMAKDAVSGPVSTRKGVIIFKLIAIEGFDEAGFGVSKDDYSTRVLELKKNLALEEWLRGLEKANALNIDPGEYEKYYR